MQETYIKMQLIAGHKRCKILAASKFTVENVLRCKIIEIHILPHY